ncbi:hypothetical protein [Streptomyces sp. H39-S7]|uniref:hypothetical protein n=1 Tax=Streptomyces sp. H39-S7 TaxID=3004357 RepID=UPI0022AEC326|nr:hypothetical protein [Streptomyces sp. H39-S7]MCZ4121771.1 hypothetical protein [Streptomyces sp. H39-S7]
MAAGTDEEDLLPEGRQRLLSLVDWVAERPKDGLVLRNFLMSIALAGLRPTEAMALRVRDVVLPDEGAGVLLSRTLVRGAGDAEAVRRVPARPDLMAILKAEIARRDLGPDDAVFVLDDGRPLTATIYRRVWRQARAAVLEPHEIDSPLGRKVSSLRDACIASWLRNGDQTAAHIVAVAEFAGMSAPRLVDRFAHCLRKPTWSAIPWDRLEAALDLPGLALETKATARRP